MSLDLASIWGTTGMLGGSWCVDGSVCRVEGKICAESSGFTPGRRCCLCGCVFMSDQRADETFQCLLVPVVLISSTSRRDEACTGVCFACAHKLASD